jgi:hypothetical protein
MLPTGCAGELEVPVGVAEVVGELVGELVDVGEPDSSVVELDGLGELVSSGLDVLLDGSLDGLLDVLLASAADVVAVPVGVSSASAGALKTAESSSPVAAAIAAPRRPFRPALTS